MEVFMHNLPVMLAVDEIKAFLASIIHGELFGFIQTNFTVHLHKPGPRSRAGTFTLADETVARKFLLIYGPSGLFFRGRTIYFKASNKPLRQEVVEVVARSPWVDPASEREQRRKEQVLSTSTVSVSAVQFGWACRDGIYSIETEAIQSDARLCFHPQRREMHIVMQYDALHDDTIAVRHTSVTAVYKHHSTFDGKHVLLLELWMPPTFLRRGISDMLEAQAPWTRMSTFPLLDNPRALPFTSLVLRIVFTSKYESDKFLRLAEEAGWRHIQSDEVMIEQRGLFSVNNLDLLEWNLRRFNWCVAFQLASLFHNMILDPAELLELLPRVKELVRVKGKVYTAKLLREFHNHASAQWYSDDAGEPIASSFRATERDFAKQDNALALVPDDGSYYQSLHVTITPTTMALLGPYPEQSNRVLRRYDSKHHENFLRVTFRDDNDLQLRFDRDIDGPGFIKDRFGRFLKNGLSIAGRTFTFLAYSQSALKEHSVWFVRKFQTPSGDVDAGTIIDSLGTFDNLSYDPKLKFCPARYAARISQAFTATDAAVVPVEEVFDEDDIKTSDNKYVFTDGVGTMSQDLARAIWGKLRSAKRKSGKASDFPHAYQVRFRGSKGMLSIDHRLNGVHTIGLRPSMVKFETDSASGVQEVEIARAFDRPTPYYLNRPLITLLEGLGIPTNVFLKFQNDAVQETRSATSTLGKAARLLETHGLGASFRLPSTMHSLAKLGLNSIHDDAFYNKLLQIAVYHVLRDLKHHARIPIPNAWTLVGVADVHGYLQEGEVFACVKHPTQGIIYLEGLVLISRSPTIHPGDVQLVKAIGIPPEGSCFDREPLYNTVVFSVKGKRPLPSCLGGGDLDGDIYNILPLKEHPYFTPLRGPYVPAEYPPTQRKLLDRPSTMDDIADFVMEYIISDVVGIIAINWLIIADQSPAGIMDEDCIKLAQLHSDAVDYPKSGRAVDQRLIPKLKFRMRPDWNAPETINPDSANYYQSRKAVGVLFREVKLDDIPVASRSRRRRNRQPGRVETLTDDLSAFRLHDPESTVFDLVEKRVKRFLDTEGPWESSAISNVASLFKRFSTEFTGIAVNHSLSHKSVMLSEEEVLVGTITQKTSQPRARKERMTKVREATDTLVKAIRLELEGDEQRTLEDYLKYAWLAWELSFVEAKKEKFGARSFGWLALGGIFDAMKQIEEHDAAELRSLRSRRG